VPSSENLGQILQDVHTGITQRKSGYSRGLHGPATHQAMSLIPKFHKDAMARLKSKRDSCCDVPTLQQSRRVKTDLSLNKDQSHQFQAGTLCH
jgi:hypothetical protein